jgi:polyhydroxyalkanoate synthase
MPDSGDLKYGLDLTALDPASINKALLEAGTEVVKRPSSFAKALAGLALEQASVAVDVARAFLGGNGEPRVQPAPDDRRFSDRAWKENPLLLGAMESYLVSSRWTRRLLESSDIDEQKRRKALFALGFYLDALAPTNVPFLNPAVLKEALDTGGLSLVRGFANYVEDVVENNGMPRQVDTTPFKLGETIATTPGRVVYRNDLMELIAYEPQTEQVYSQPIVYSPAWINKYYVMDLAPGRSFIEHAVQQGFTVFAISYRNPDASMAGLALDDYLRDGLLTALAQAREITGSEVANVVAVCLGGTLTVMGLAVLAARGEASQVGWATLNNTLVDYGEPGDLGIFADEMTLESVEKKNKERGFTEASELGTAFNWLRGNDLVWNYVVSNWQMGRQPPAFDILAWNADSTRLPATMHSQFLRTCYLDNALTKPGALSLDGVPVDVSKIETPLYVLSAQNDHIAPWRSSYRTTQLVSGPSRQVLASGGHVAGMVNPPGNPKAFYWHSDDTPPNPDDWLAGAAKEQGSWWEDWAAWAAERSGEKVEPPTLPDGAPAPGTYVRA